jgi:thymidylate kinase
LANALARSSHISGHLLSVPANLKSFRPYFDKQNEVVKRDFFHLWDIVVSNALLSSPDTTVVILDRYWPTTIAYRLAHQGGLMSSDENIRWPSYLVRPSHIVYIYLDEEERQRRIAQRQTAIPISDEEKRIASEPEFRSRFDKIYRKIPGIHPINGNQSTEKMIDEILDWYKKSSAKTT